MNRYQTKFFRESYPDVSPDLVPGQALDLVDLWNRFNRGQRLLVNQRPINLYECDEDGNYIDPNIKDEDFNQVLPDIEDRVDLEDYLSDIKTKKSKIKDLKDKLSKKGPKEEPKKEPKEEPKE